jgi:hypothetical protein
LAESEVKYEKRTREVLIGSFVNTKTKKAEIIKLTLEYTVMITPDDEFETGDEQTIKSEKIACKWIEYVESHHKFYDMDLSHHIIEDENGTRYRVMKDGSVSVLNNT